MKNVQNHEFQTSRTYPSDSLQIALASAFRLRPEIHRIRPRENSNPTPKGKPNPTINGSGSDKNGSEHDTKKIRILILNRKYPDLPRFLPDESVELTVEHDSRPLLNCSPPALTQCSGVCVCVCVCVCLFVCSCSFFFILLPLQCGAHCTTVHHSFIVLVL